MKQTLFGAPISTSANDMTDPTKTENAPVPGATQTTSGEPTLLLRAKKTFSVPVKVPVRSVSTPDDVNFEALPDHAAYSVESTRICPRKPVWPDAPNRERPGDLRQTAGGGASFFVASMTLPSGSA
jgi:hypothetical protein